MTSAQAWSGQRSLSGILTKELVGATRSNNPPRREVHGAEVLMRSFAQTSVSMISMAFVTVEGTRQRYWDPTGPSIPQSGRWSDASYSSRAPTS